MDTDRYDIFLSYRRRGGFETAKHLFDLLTRDGYSVSFDIDTLRAGDFDTTLLRRIDQCTDFILILDREAFDRNKDWMRIELAYALDKGKNIIPVMLSGFTEFPDNLPADIAAVERKNGPKYDQYYFDAFYAKLLRFLDSRPVERAAAPFGEPAAGSSTLKIKSDTDCRIFVDDEERGTARAGSLFRLPLRGGSYLLRFVSVENPADAVERAGVSRRMSKSCTSWHWRPSGGSARSGKNGKQQPVLRRNAGAAKPICCNCPTNDS